MIAFVENGLKFVARSAQRNRSRLLCTARFSTDKKNEQQPDHKAQKNEETKTQSTQQIQQIDKDKLIEKFNNFSNKIDALNKQLEDHKDFDETISHYKKLNKELQNGRNKITELIEGGKKQWDMSKHKITLIEDKNLIDFGKQLIKFNHKLKQLSQFKVKEEQGVLAEGIGMTSRILNNALLKFNFRHYQPLKQKYDPKKHTKVGQKEPKKDSVITKVVEPGWIYKNTVIQQPKVEV